MTSRYEKFVKLTHRMMQRAVDLGIIRIEMEDERFDDSTITVASSRLVNFGTCSYLGINRDKRLKMAAHDAIDRFGPNYSSSTVYTRLSLTGELEEKLSQIFDAPVLVAPTTTLAHLSALPVLAFEGDLVILDQNAHATLHLAADVLRGRGVRVETVGHNDVDALRERLVTASGHFDKIWYIADGLYSMFGDFAPAAEIAPLLDEFPEFHVYYDEAHSMGWLGKHGRGHVLSQVPWHPRMVIAAGLSKSFGASGGVLAFGTAEMRQRVLLCGAAFTFSGPVQVASLGAAIASADIHLSPEHEVLQTRLFQQIDLMEMLLAEHDLAVVHSERSPIWFVKVGPAEATAALVRGLMDDGFYTNPATFPALPLGSAGIRFTQTLHHSEEDIRNLVRAIARRVNPEMTEIVIDLTDSATMKDTVTAVKTTESNT